MMLQLDTDNRIKPSMHSLFCSVPQTSFVSTCIENLMKKHLKSDDICPSIRQQDQRTSPAGLRVQLHPKQRIEKEHWWCPVRNQSWEWWLLQLPWQMCQQSSWYQAAGPKSNPYREESASASLAAGSKENSGNIQLKMLAALTPSSNGLEISTTTYYPVWMIRHLIASHTVHIPSSSRISLGFLWVFRFLPPWNTFIT